MDILEKLVSGDVIEIHILVFFSGMVAALIFLVFAGRALIAKKGNGPVRSDPRPKKSWKNFCRTEKRD